MNEVFLQQTLDLSIHNKKTFDNFICTSNLNQKNMLMFYLQKPSEKMILLTGDPGCGKTHLLHAACHYFQNLGKFAAYISLKNPTEIESLLTRKLNNTLICVDDIHLAKDHSDLEHLLFKLYNHAELEGCLLIWAQQSEGNVSRKDLQSRLQSMLRIGLNVYPPNEILAILLQYLQVNQSSISPAICEYLIKHYTRNVSQIIRKIKEIEQHALSIQKKVSLKMAKELTEEFHLLDE